MPLKKKDDKLKKFLEGEFAGRQKWLSQHPAPKLGDNDVNPEYVAEYHRAQGQSDILLLIKTML